MNNRVAALLAGMADQAQLAKERHEETLELIRVVQQNMASVDTRHHKDLVKAMQGGEAKPTPDSGELSKPFLVRHKNLTADDLVDDGLVWAIRERILAKLFQIVGSAVSIRYGPSPGYIRVVGRDTFDLSEPFVRLWREIDGMVGQAREFKADKLAIEGRKDFTKSPDTRA